MTETKVQSPIEDFDWAAYENGETAGSKSREELVNTYDESLKTAKDNEVVTGVVKSISKREVRVDIGMKSDAIIPVSEFRYNPDLKVGDEVEVFIETLEDKNGQSSVFPTRKHARPAAGIASTRLSKTTRSSKATLNHAPKAA